ncbi:MAG TPA: divalent metal cation transporter [Nitrososphaeraceae archaeon]
MTTDDTSGPNERRIKEDKLEDYKYNNDSIHYKKGIVSAKLSRFLPRRFLIKSLGPGIITGAADEDPSTIGTYSQAGVQFGFGLLWMALFQYPMIVAVQEMCARMGLVTGSGLAAIIKKRYSRKIVLAISSLILIANTINIGADIGAMAASVKLLVPQSMLCYYKGTTESV